MPRERRFVCPVGERRKGMADAKMPRSVIKSDGTVEEFNPTKLKASIEVAGAETGEYGEDDATVIGLQASKVIAQRFDGATPSTGDIQDIVEGVMTLSNFDRTARHYIGYTERHGGTERRRTTYVDAVASVNEYLSQSDWRVHANANQGYSLGGMILNIAGKVTADYWLDYVYPPEVGEAHRDGSFHIHDLDMLSGYCAGWSLRTLLNEGFNGVGNKIESAPPRHLSTALGQMVNFLGTLQNEWAGAQAFSSADTYLAPFVRADGLSYEQVLQEMQSFVYSMNVPSRWGGQCPFTNLTFDISCPDDVAHDHPLIGGRPADFTYGDCAREMEMINLAFCEIMTRGDDHGRAFTFPIPTYNITDAFEWDTPVADAIFGMTAKYGLPYFSNFLSSDMDPHMIRSMCCRLRLDLTELLKRGNGLFGSAEQTGSIGVVTINLPRLGYKHAGDEKGLYEELDRLMGLAKTSLELKRAKVQELIDSGFLPYTKRYLGTTRNHFSTIGVNGGNEMVRNFTHDHDDVTTPEGHALMVRVLEHMRGKMIEFQEETGHMYNLEATPGESTTRRFSHLDKERYPGILQSGRPGSPFYTNSTQLPVDYTDDPFKALDEQEDLQTMYTGGTVLHLYIGERIDSVEACKQLVRRSLENFREPYITITPTFSICPKHGYIAGEHRFCPLCDEEIAQAKRAAQNLPRQK